jgi:hypothetical protein
VLKRMRLPYLRAAAPEVLATARAQRWDPAEVLRVLITEEIRGRDEATRRMRRRAAGLPAGKTFQSWRETDSSIYRAARPDWPPWSGSAGRRTWPSPDPAAPARPTLSKRSHTRSLTPACGSPGSPWNR